MLQAGCAEGDAEGEVEELLEVLAVNDELAVDEAVGLSEDEGVTDADSVGGGIGATKTDDELKTTAWLEKTEVRVELERL